jgi:hypothetical protein
MFSRRNANIKNFIRLSATAIYCIWALTVSEEGEAVYRKIGFWKLKDFYIFNTEAL